MSAEDQEILAKISQLAGEFIATISLCLPSTRLIMARYPTGQINRRKNGQTPDQQLQSNPPSRASSGASMKAAALRTKHSTDNVQDPSQSSLGWRSSRGGYLPRGHSRGSRTQLHRNRTLVLNSNTSTPPNSATADSSADNSESAPWGSSSTQGWVTKTDRHLQLINASIFEKDSQSRAKAMEETRKQKLRQKDEREKARFNKHIYRMRGHTDPAVVHSRSTDSAENYEIVVQGIRFRVAKNGSKLVKVPGERMDQPP